MIELSDVYEIPSIEHNQQESYTMVSFNGEIAYDDFFRNHLLPNVPCLFKGWLTDDWLARKNWVTCEGQPNLNYLEEHFGHALVPLADCDKKLYDSQEKEVNSLTRYISYLRARFLQTTNGQERCLYLKDWHFYRTFSDHHVYRTPAYFSSDWLNEFWEHRNDLLDDYRFVYMGPSGSWTPFHADVFRSYSWSSNICGKKRWIFYPPEEDKNLRDKFGNLVYDVSQVEELSLCCHCGTDTTEQASRDSENNWRVEEYSLENNRGVDYKCTCGNYGNLNRKKRLEVVQEKGDTIFVPSGWYHQVWNEENTISINHNWFNGANIEYIVNFFIHSLREVENSISDCAGMDGFIEQCQLILKSTHGMDLREFLSLINLISYRRINHIEKNIEMSTLDGWIMGKHHVQFDISRLHFCLETLLNKISSELLDTVEDMNINVTLDKLDILL